MCSCRCWRDPSTMDAFWLSIISLIITVVATVLGFVLFVRQGSSLWLVYGLENCVDFLSDIVVVWRFFAPCLDKAGSERLSRREIRASTAISLILILSGIATILAAIEDYRNGKENVTDQQAIMAISLVSFILFGILAMFKFQYSIKLDSSSLYKDGICSLIGTILSAALLINTLLIQQSADLWWFDPIVAMFAGIAATIIGLQGVVYARITDKLPIYSYDWWMASHGDRLPISSSSEMREITVV